MNWHTHFIHTGGRGAQRYREVMGHCTDELVQLFESATTPYSGLDPGILQQRIADTDLSPNATAVLEDVIKEVRETIAEHSIIVQHPHCIAHLHTPPLISGLAAERFIAAQNLSMDSWDQSGAATYVEQRMVNELCKLFDYPAHADGVMTSGGTQGNVMALLIARDRFIWNRYQHHVQRDGLPECASKLRIIASKRSHFTVEKAASIMGLGQKAVVKVPTNVDGTMDMRQLVATIQQLQADGLIPFAVVGTAGTTDHGAIDDLVQINQQAKLHGLWFHVDGAYGSALILSKEKQRLAGIELADSLVLDFHKLWFQPISCGALLLRDGTCFNHLLYKAEYLNRETDDLPNLVDKTLSTTRRFDALKVYMMLRTVGTHMLGAMIDHLLRQTLEIAEKIRQHSEFELLTSPCLTTILFRYVAIEPHTLLDEFNRKLRSALLKNGVAVLGETTVNGYVSLKLTILNPCLTELDFVKLVNTISLFARTLRNDSGKVAIAL